MARASTTYDVFNAIGEPKRRQIVEALVLKPMTVSELVEQTRWSQPVVSKHLKVLKQVRIVAERIEGRYRYYSLQPDELRPIQEWMCQFEKYWGGTMDQLDQYLSELTAKGSKSE